VGPRDWTPRAPAGYPRIAIVHVALALPPSSSVTVRVTVYVPAPGNACDTASVAANGNVPHGLSAGSAAKPSL